MQGLKSLIDPIARHPITRPKQAAKAGEEEGPSSPNTSLASPPSLQPAVTSPQENGEEATREVGARPILTTALSDDSASVAQSDEDARSQLGMTSKRLPAGSGFRSGRRRRIALPAAHRQRRENGSQWCREYINPGGLLDKTETMFAQWSGATKMQKITPAQTIPQGRPKGALADYEVCPRPLHILTRVPERIVGF